MLLRLYGNNGQCEWTLVGAQPYDALLVDASKYGTHDSLQAGMEARRVRRIARGLNDPDVLHRPLNAGQLRRWLDEVEQSLPATTSTEPSAPELPLQPQETAKPSIQLPSETPSLTPDGGPRFRLKRWPHQILLRKDPARIRIATLLSRRALNAHDLVTLTGLDPQRCMVFLQVLQASSLLTLVPPDTASQTTGSPGGGSGFRATEKSENHSRGAQDKSRPTGTFIAGLRKMLGL